MQAIKPIRVHTFDRISRSNFPQFRSYALSVQDLQRLQEHLQRPDLAWLPLVAHVLRHKIRMAKRTNKLQFTKPMQVDIFEKLNSNIATQYTDPNIDECHSV